MSTHSAGWTHCVDVLRHAPQSSFEHKIGDRLADADNDGAWSLLIEVVTEDPCNTTEYAVAAHMIGHLMEPEVAR